MTFPATPPATGMMLPARAGRSHPPMGPSPAVLRRTSVDSGGTDGSSRPYRLLHVPQLLNRPDPTGDFNEIRFGQGELFLWVSPDGVVRGTLGFPADPLAAEKDFLDVTGRVTGWSPAALELEGIGRPGTPTERVRLQVPGCVGSLPP